MCAALLKMKRELQQAPPGQRTGASCTHLCMLQYSANMAILCYYMCLLSCEGCRHVQRTVRNAKESYNELHQVKALVPIAHVPDSAAHARGPRNLADTCNSPVQPYLRSIGACTSVCNWHQSFDLVKLIVALFFIFNNAAHICGLSYFN